MKLATFLSGGNQRPHLGSCAKHHNAAGPYGGESRIGSFTFRKHASLN